MTFFDSGIGQYLSQVVCYSLITLICLETLLAGWRITGTTVLIRFRLTALFIPVLSPFLFAAWPGQRADTFFREQVAFFDLATWFREPLFLGVTVGHIILATLGLTTAVFLVKEAGPAARHLFRRRERFSAMPAGTHPGLETAVAELSRALGIRAPVVCLSPEKAPVAHVAGAEALIVSESVLSLLEEDEIRSLVGHELAHLSFRVRWVNRLLLTLRWLQFYNPLAFPLFHRIHGDIEKWCDDIAGRLTGRPLGLPSALLKINRTLAGQGRTGRTSWLGAGTLEHAANMNDVRDRVRRIVRPATDSAIPYPDLRLVTTGLMLLALLYFIV